MNNIRLLSCLMQKDSFFHFINHFDFEPIINCDQLQTNNLKHYFDETFILTKPEWR